MATRSGWISAIPDQMGSFLWYRSAWVGALASIFLFGPAISLAADGNVAAELGWGKLLQLLAALGLTVAVIYLLAFGMKRMRWLPAASTPVFTVLGSMNLGAREKLYLVQVGQEQLVLGSSNKGLETLHVMQQAINVPAGPAPAANAFGNVLARFNREQM